MADRTQRAEGKAEELKGRVKRGAGAATGDRSTEAKGAGELIQFCRAFLFRSAFCLNDLACVRGTNNLEHFVAPRDAREDLRLAIGKRRVIGKGYP